MGFFITTADASKLYSLAILSHTDKATARFVWRTLTFDRLLAKSASELIVQSTRRWPKRRTPAARLAEAYLRETQHYVPPRMPVTRRMRWAMRHILLHAIRTDHHG